ncbi:MAG: chemotaxis protein CheW [Desulfobacterales bacterium]|nr:chemotaxis protein CheW [Desulfobacterales bacterium]
MDNNELLAYIAEEKSGHPEEKPDGSEKSVKFLIVQIKEKKYAFHVEQIKEIVINAPLFFVPFVPHYIRGFINRHGEPFTVFDLNALFEKEKLDSATFLISSLKNDQIAFLASGIVEIVKVLESEIHLITSADLHNDYFLGAITSKDSEIFILNLPNIISRLEHDLETS